MPQETERFSWKEHHVLQGDGRGGFVVHPAEYQFVPRFGEFKVLPFGLSAMDNGEILLMGAARTGKGPSAYGEMVATISADGGATWSAYETVGYGAAVRLTYLGGGTLCRHGDGPTAAAAPGLYFSHDYGRTWPEKVPLPQTPSGKIWSSEGNGLVDRDARGRATLVGWTSGHRPDDVDDKPWGSWPSCAFVCWSHDGGRTFENYSYPEAWKWTDTFAGQTWERSCSDGALVRAANGWIVAAKRMDVPARYIDYHYDSFTGTGVSISRDEGKTWSPIRHVLEAGRHHANLHCLANGDLVLSAVRRLDIRGDRLASYRLGCDALVSHDHGLSWNADRMYILDDWPHLHHRDLGAVTWETGDMWYGCASGHLASVCLGDGSLITTYGHYAYGGALIKWRPA